ncbi:hypothetical protein HBH56_165450 [Parastagonospora nodorum]|uniref:Uncharacterized protein n=1 Tax=Phaeosphaeria nodorum (strain SN15 / ATCC MYA-4574 / FGSC 10173) TaxID=321614 RepID=A0A7U2I098_PHANO|nr:hypothetical protein HBH56_165450 [Parastagonospora nodorum]QRC98490.1 hypothetical protein JI435_412150 [Parastagonospora nodorum SN15]KAH3936186.1 hypothetical protein HBH54_028540 [Parastagonospora nodorum]KAH3968621.1 hypothetical protein HBH51_127210 [Parastagonospora nodorum]KAH3989404.1 hypothetical protein HBH52_014710 [Parastagonospora nodorum]
MNTWRNVNRLLCLLARRRCDCSQDWPPEVVDTSVAKTVSDVMDRVCPCDARSDAYKR